MNEKKPAKWISSEWFYALVSLWTLITFVVAQSVYEVLAANPEFLTVRRVSNLQLVEIILVFNLLSALGLFLFWAVSRKLHRGVARIFLSGAYFLLFFAFFLQIHNAYLAEWQPFPHSYLLWIVPASLLLLASLRFENTFRSFVLILSPTVLLFPILFLSRTWTGPQQVPPEIRQIAQAASLTDGHKVFPPVFLLVFDELTQHILLDDEGQIDGTRFPNFKKLADESYWFRNTTANAEETLGSIPVILTGNFPRSRDASYRTYPNNLFTLLHPYYRDMYIYEMDTEFCIQTLFRCPDKEIESSHSEFLRDLFYLYVARVLPVNINVNRRNMTRTWDPFRTIRDQTTARVERFETFVNSLGSQEGNSAFYYYHNPQTHSPYALTSDGKVYEATPANFDQRYKRQAPILKDLVDRYRMQVGYGDRQLGSLLTHLEELALYDRALIILTSDHGVSWKLESPGRFLSEENAEMVLTVPLFIKPPHLRKGTVSDQDVQLIDIVPTIADLLGIPVPWEHEGRSVFATRSKERLKVAYNANGNRFEFPKDLGLTRIEEQFSTEPPRSPLLGQALDSFTVRNDEEVAGWLDNISEQLIEMEADGDEFPVSVYGWAALLDKQSVPELIAVAVNGTIVSVTTPCCERPEVARLLGGPGLLKSGWRARFSTRYLSEGANVVTAYVVVETERKTLVALRTMEQNVIHRNTAKRRETSSLIGQRVDTMSVQQNDAIVGYLDTLPVSRITLHPNNDETEILAYGWAAIVSEGKIPSQIAVAVNGTIVALTSPCCVRPDVAKHLQNKVFLNSGWEASLSSRHLHPGENKVRAYVVLDAKAKELAPLRVVKNTIHAIPR